MKETKIQHIGDNTSITAMFLRSLNLVMCLNSNSRKLHYWEKKKKARGPFYKREMLSVHGNFEVDSYFFIYLKH